ncbi:GNAT family N-acetyltransferase [Sphingomonas montana]|uniref:GNAT family N-acetyltransferase n=1 Tax=Sphingomonas montana TaxID=1843236 RepID=UPI00096BFE16|nr:GNAT family N-acetyltransferase [Sphingomonas montana]
MHVNVHLYEDLAAVAADAGPALDRAAQPNLFDRIAWFRLIAAHLADLRPVVIRAECDGARAWLFLTDRGGGRAEALACWYTLGFAPVFAGAGGHDRLLAACAKEAKARFRLVTLSPMTDEDRTLVERAFVATGWGTIATPATIRHAVAVEGDFATWWAGRPGKLRNTAKRKAKASAFRIEIADGFDPTLWAAYETVYADSWKGAEGAPALLRALVEQEGAAGTLRLGIAFLKGAPVAAQWWLVERGQATIHKLAYVDAARALSPGTVLTAAMFRHVIDRDRPTAIDFGTGDDPYKADWMDERQQLWRVDLFRLSSPSALLRYARARAAALVRGAKGR